MDVKLPTIYVPEHLITAKASRSSGPGGQGVNKTESKIELRINITDAAWLNEEQRHRLIKNLSPMITHDGDLIVRCQETRSQQENYRIALDKLNNIINEAIKPPKLRKPTRATKASKKRKAEQKSKQSRKKQQRRSQNWDD